MICKLKTFRIKKAKFIHETSPKIATKIMKEGIKPSKNPNILKGIYTLPESELRKNEKIKNESSVQLRLTTKEKSNFYSNGANRPINAIFGEGNKDFKCLYKNIGRKINATPSQIYDSELYRQKYERELFKRLKENNIDIYQNGAEIIIINPKIIEKIEKK